MYHNEYPYTNFHDINLDWVLEKTKECVEKVGAAESVAQQAQDTAQTAKTTAETAQTEAATAAQTAANSATVAQEAKATADGIDAKATQALEKAGNAEAEVGSATQAATEATQAAQNATNTAAAAQTAAENAQAAAQAANNTANQAESTATEAKNIADTNTAAIGGIQTKLVGIAKMYNITVGTVWTSDTGYVKQEIAVDGLVPGVVNIFDIDIQPEQLASAADYVAEWAKIIKCETQNGHVNIYATEATTLQLSVLLGVVTNG